MISFKDMHINAGTWRPPLHIHEPYNRMVRQISLVVMVEVRDFDVLACEDSQAAINLFVQKLNEIKQQASAVVDERIKELEAA